MGYTTTEFTTPIWLMPASSTCYGHSWYLYFDRGTSDHSSAGLPLVGWPLAILTIMWYKLFYVYVRSHIYIYIYDVPLGHPLDIFSINNEIKTCFWQNFHNHHPYSSIHPHPNSQYFSIGHCHPYTCNKPRYLQGSYTVIFLICFCKIKVYNSEHGHWFSCCIISIKG